MQILIEIASMKPAGVKRSSKIINSWQMCDISSQMMTVNQSSHVNIINPEERNIGRISNDVLGGLLGKYNPASCEI